MTKITGFSQILATVLLISCLASQNLLAAISFAEANLADQIRKNLRHGEAVELAAGDNQILAVYQQSSPPVKQGGVIILHGQQRNPDSPGIIRSLRHKLSGGGWDSLSVQMPIPILATSTLDLQAYSEQAATRINAAVSFFSEKNITNLAIIGQDIGAAAAAAYLQTSSDGPVKAFAMISLDASQEFVLEVLQRQTIPIIDVYGSRDHQAVIETASQRKQAVVQGAANPNYRQVVMQGADQYFTGMQDSLASMLRSWLSSQASGVQLMPASAAKP